MGTLNRGLILAAAIASAGLGAIGAATKHVPNSIEDFGTALKSLKGRYRFAPYTQKNIGKNYYKRRSRRYASENGAQEIQRRLNQQHLLETFGPRKYRQLVKRIGQPGKHYTPRKEGFLERPAFVPVKITPRREMDFTSHRADYRRQWKMIKKGQSHASA